jgi:ankyrin repeat protein
MGACMSHNVASKNMTTPAPVSEDKKNAEPVTDHTEEKQDEENNEEEELDDETEDEENYSYFDANYQEEDEENDDKKWEVIDKFRKIIISDASDDECLKLFDEQHVNDTLARELRRYAEHRPRIYSKVLDHTFKYFFLNTELIDLFTSAKDTLETIKTLEKCEKFKKMFSPKLFRQIFPRIVENYADKLSCYEPESFPNRENIPLDFMLNRLDYLMDKFPLDEEETISVYGVINKIYVLHAVKEGNKELLDGYINDLITTPEEVLKISICLAKSGDLEIARDMVKRGEKPDQTLSIFLEYSRNHLSFSAEEEERFLLERTIFLLDLGANPHILEEAMGLSVPGSVIKKLIDSGADVNDSKYDALLPSIKECYDDEKETQYAKVLIDSGIELNKLIVYENFEAPVLVHMINSAENFNVPNLMAANGANLEKSFTYNNEEITPLAYFALKMNSRAVKWLLEHKADPNFVPSGGKHVLNYADPTSNIFTALIQGGADISHVLNDISDVQSRNSISEYIKQGKQQEAISMLQLYYKKVHIEKEKNNMPNFNRSFLVACGRGDLDSVKIYVSLGANPHQDISVRDSSRVSQSGHPLIYAANSGKTELVKYLLEECKVDPNAVSEREVQDGRHHDMKRSKNGVVAVLNMDYRTNHRIINWVLNNLKKDNRLNAKVATYYFSGRDENKEDRITYVVFNFTNLARNRLIDMTLLHYFAKGKNEDVCRLLIRHGADPSIRCHTSLRHTDGEATGPTPFELYSDLPAIFERETTAIGRLGKKAQSVKRFVDVLFVTVS